MACWHTYYRLVWSIQSDCQIVIINLHIHYKFNFTSPTSKWARNQINIRARVLVIISSEHRRQASAFLTKPVLFTFRIFFFQIHWEFAVVCSSVCTIMSRITIPECRVRLPIPVWSHELHIKVFTINTYGWPPVARTLSTEHQVPALSLCWLSCRAIHTWSLRHNNITAVRSSCLTSWLGRHYSLVTFTWS